MSKIQNRGKFLERKTQTNRTPREMILIVVEGEETEYNYFEKWRQQLRLSTIAIQVVSSSHSDPLSVVNYAYSLQKQRIKESQQNQNKLKYDQVFCVIDGDKVNQNYYQAIELAKKYKFHLIVSIPCFELWFLLHFNYSTKSYQSCDNLIQNLKKYIKNYQKNNDIFDLIYPNLKKALENSQKLTSFQIKNDSNIYLANPITLVDQLIQELIKQKNMI